MDAATWFVSGCWVHFILCLYQLSSFPLGSGSHEDARWMSKVITEVGGKKKLNPAAQNYLNFSHVFLNKWFDYKVLRSDWAATYSPAASVLADSSASLSSLLKFSLPDCLLLLLLPKRHWKCFMQINWIANSTGHWTVQLALCFLCASSRWALL